MPAIVREAEVGGSVMLEARRWDGNDNRSLMSPTALAFLIPVLVILFLAPFLCVYCIRTRQRDQPVRRNRPAKLPALERSEARERLESVAEVSNVTGVYKSTCVDHVEEKARSDSVSTLEKECAICLSTLHAPSPPEPAKLTNESSVVDKAGIAPSKIGSEQEEILKLKECGHEFHAECLVSWVVLHKKSCPICRTVYYHEESEKSTDVEAQPEAGVVQDTAGAEPIPNSRALVTNWHYFWTGRVARQQHTHPGLRSSWQQFRSFRS